MTAEFLGNFLSIKQADISMSGCSSGYLNAEQVTKELSGCANFINYT